VCSSDLEYFETKIPEYNDLLSYNHIFVKRTANVGVIDAHAQDPDNFVFYNTVQIRFPEDSTVGLVDSDDESIQMGMLILFARNAGGLFYDHQVEAPE